MEAVTKISNVNAFEQLFLHCKATLLPVSFAALLAPLRGHIGARKLCSTVKLFEIEANNLIALSGRPLTVQLFA